LWSGVSFTVTGNQVRIPEALGGGRVCYCRGVWKTDALFAWGGFRVSPESGDSNYYPGGTFVNIGNETIITLGSPLPDGTPVQVYYIYYTGERAARYEALNTLPCIRRAWRGPYDYTYDFAVDRIFDAMAAIAFAYREQGWEAAPLLAFLWESYYEHAASKPDPLVWDDFNRQFYDRGAYLLYANSTLGATGLSRFGTVLASSDGNSGRVLRFKPSYYHGPGFSAWFGYGFNWDLSQEYFNTISRVKFKLKTSGAVSRVYQSLKTGGTGTAAMILVDGLSQGNVTSVQITVTQGGAPGTAVALVERYGPGRQFVSEETIVCPASAQPVELCPGLAAYWQEGTLAEGDTWLITCGNLELRPHRLQVILNNSRPTDADAYGPEHTFVHGLGDYYPNWGEFDLSLQQFWRLDNIIDCRDRRPGCWGNWSVHRQGSGSPQEMFSYDICEEESIAGEVFYTKHRCSWNMDPATLEALGFFVGIPPEVDSQGRTTLNYLIRQYTDRALTIRTKVRDANGNYFYHDDVVVQNRWVRVAISLASLLPESGGTLTHPLNLVDIGLAADPPAQGSFDLLDLKFDEHQTYPGDRLRLVEFKFSEGNIRLSAGPDYYVDDFGFDLRVADPYPYAPRLAISLNAYGRNPWRGPTLVHYSHPLAPFLVNRFDIKNTLLGLHQDAQVEFHRRYGGVKGPILPVHTRNDVENIALCGEENFNRFTWWPRYRHHGKEIASWRFNETLADASGEHVLTMTSGSPAWSGGICQPGDTSLSLPGTGPHAYCSGTDFHLGNDDFALEMVVKINTPKRQALVGRWDQAGDQRSWIFYLSAENKLVFVKSANGISLNTITSDLAITDTDWHHIGVTKEGSTLRFFLDGEIQELTQDLECYNSSAPLRIGSAESAWPGCLNGDIDYLAIQKGRSYSSAEIAGRWQIIQGVLNGSDYPEVGHGLGQYWAFYRLGEYYFASNDAGAWDILTNWLDWFDTYMVADGSGWKFPIWFSEYGFTYGDYDPGAAASIALGALYIYMRNGDDRALDITQKILADLRENRASGDYGGYLYKSDYHYAWMNALVAHAFGMAVVGRAGAAYRYPYKPEDEVHFRKMMANFWARSGDTKPNLLNRDLIPYHAVEAQDIWDYAPHYLFMKEMGSMEGVVLMMHLAIDWALYDGSWHWFQSLCDFLVEIGAVELSERQLYAVSANYLTSAVATRVSLTYGDYKRNPQQYVEVADQDMMDQLGDIRQMLPMHYGSPVITEDVQTATKIAQRALQYFSQPQEMVRAVADLTAARLEVNDRVKITSQFHGFAKDSFTVIRRAYDSRKFRVVLDLLRSLTYRPSWAVDESGGVYDSYAIQVGSQQDGDWPDRAYAN